MEKFGSIEQFKNVVKSVRDYSKRNGTPLPVLEFTGTVKIHGTNASVVFNKDGSHEFQSRERVLSIQSDNAGFCMWGERNVEILRQTKDRILAPYEKLVIYGEWCGVGVQSGVAISQIGRKIFVIFNITLIDAEGNRKEMSPDQIKEYTVRSEDIFTTYDFQTYKVAIDFNNPEAYQNTLVNHTLDVENECPVGKHFGISGIGEGIVFWNHSTNLKFKVKGEKHSVSKVKTLKEIAAVDIERMKSIEEFISTVVTENRLNQGFDKLKEMGLPIDISSTGAYIKWVVGDSLKEEKDVILASSFEIKDLTPSISKKAKDFYFKTIDNLSI